MLDQVGVETRREVGVGKEGHGDGGDPTERSGRDPAVGGTDITHRQGSKD